MTNWSNEQQAIFDWFANPTGEHLVVRARAGTGKTTTIIEAIRHAPEHKVLLAAFNLIIAKELRQRVSHPGAEVKTLHALGLQAIRRYRKIRVDDKGRRRYELVRAVYGGDIPRDVVRVIAELHTKVREIRPFITDAREVQAIAARFNITPDRDMVEDGWDEAAIADAALCVVHHVKEQWEQGSSASSIATEVDFADMIFLPLVFNLLKPRYNLVVVDEAQDLTRAQLMLAQRACRPAGRVAIVGDDRQAIYAFRGAAADALDNLKHELSATELSLTTTYRCPTSVVELAQKLVPDYRAAPSAPKGVVKYGVICGEGGAREGDFVLSRTNAPLAKICMKLLANGIRATIRGRDIGKGIRAMVKRFKAKSIKDVEDGLKQWREHELKRIARQVKAEQISDKTADARTEFIEDQYTLVFDLCFGLSSVAELYARLDALFSDDVNPAKVICSTVHKAKGLEAERVFVLDETFQHKKRRKRHYEDEWYHDDYKDDYEDEYEDEPDLEEQNIRYVAITRAKETLIRVREVS